MKQINLTPIVVFIMMFALSFLLVLSFSSCSDAKQATKHFDKFIKYGGKVNCKSDTIWHYDTTYINGEPVIDSFPIPCNCPEIEAPKTQREIKWKYKYDLKQQKARDAFVIDSMNKVLTNEVKHAQIKRKSDKNAFKQNTKTETANNKTVNIGLIVFGVVASLVLLLLLFIKFKK